MSFSLGAGFWRTERHSLSTQMIHHMTLILFSDNVFWLQMIRLCPKNPDLLSNFPWFRKSGPGSAGSSAQHLTRLQSRADQVISSSTSSAFSSKFMCCQQNSVPYSCRTKALSSKNPAAVPWQMSLSIGSSHHANMLLQSSIISLCGESNYRLYLFNRNSWNICTLRLPNSF